MPEVRRRKAHDAQTQLVAHEAEQTLAEPALIGINVELEEPINAHQGQECRAEYQEIVDLIQFNTEDRFREPLAADRLIHNPFGQF